MDKRGIILVVILVIVLGCFFQFNRMDGFLYLHPLRNQTMLPDRGQRGNPVDIDRETYLILYDPLDVSSVFANHRLTSLLEQQKKAVVSASIYDADTEIKSSYRGVLLATGQLDRVASLNQIRRYTADGGTAVVLMRLESSSGQPLAPDLLRDLGVKSLGPEQEVRGIHLWTDFLFGGKGFSFGEGTVYQTSCSQVSLTDDAILDVSAEAGMPLVWEHAAGAGKYLIYNGTVRDDKTNIGILTALAAHCGEDGIYPVLGTKLFFIDDFPSPIPEGSQEKIDQELHMTTENFYRQRWWPYMRSVAKDFGLKYTGMIIESYGDQVRGPFKPNSGQRDRNNFITYGRELLDMGGELGIHGYNHQSLAPAGYNQQDLDYVPWASKEDMVESLKELRRYIESVYPAYRLQTYVPPSDILSPEGRAAVLEVFPEVKVFSSLYDGPAAARAYIQDYQRNDDGTYEIPRTTAGYCPNEQNMYEQIAMINYMGNFSHFVHPDEMFYEESAAISWADMEQGLRHFLTGIQTRYDWLRPVTASECKDYLADYFDMDYRVTRESGRMVLHCWNYRHPLRFILRTKRTIDHVDGASFEKAGDDAYMIETQQDEAIIYWKGETS